MSPVTIISPPPCAASADVSKPNQPRPKRPPLISDRRLPPGAVGAAAATGARVMHVVTACPTAGGP